MAMNTNTFGKTSILIDVETAQTLLELVRGMDFTTMTRAQVMALNAFQLNAEAIIEEDNIKYDDGVNSQQFTNFTDNVGDR